MHCMCTYSTNHLISLRLMLPSQQRCIYSIYVKPNVIGDCFKVIIGFFPFMAQITVGRVIHILIASPMAHIPRQCRVPRTHKELTPPQNPHVKHHNLLSPKLNLAHLIPPPRLMPVIDYFHPFRMLTFQLCLISE